MATQNATALSNPSSIASRPYTSSYNSSPYNYSSPYSSPYSRFGGGMGSSMYGGGGMYGNSMYGGGGMYGNSMYGGGMNGMYGGQPQLGPDGQPLPQNMMSTFAQSTQASFQMIEGLATAFGGFAQMLESTYMATHSSFFAMVSVADQLATLRNSLGSFLGIFTILRWLRTLYAKVTGRPPPADAAALTPGAFFSQFPSLSPANAIGADGKPTAPGAKAKPSKKPFIVFLLAVFGMPYLMGKLIRAVSKSQEEQLAQQQAQLQQQQLQNGMIDPTTGQIDPSRLPFCRVLFPFPPPDALKAGTYVPSEADLVVQKGDLVAVLDTSDPDSQGQAQGPGQQNKESDWWRCRTRDGRTGYLPRVYLEAVQRKSGGSAAGGGAMSQASSRANTMPGSVGSAATLVDGEDGTGEAAVRAALAKGLAKGMVGNDRTGSLKKEGVVGVEGFQKAWVPGQ